MSAISIYSKRPLTLTVLFWKEEEEEEERFVK